MRVGVGGGVWRYGVEWGLEGKMEMPKTFFFAVFRNLLLRVFFRGQVTGEQNNSVSEAQSAVEGKPSFALHVFNTNNTKHPGCLCVCVDVCLLTAMVPNKFLILVFVLLLALRVSASWLL